jgi:excisionase family DNA binding protein
MTLDDLARRIAELEKRVHSLETARRKGTKLFVSRREAARRLGIGRDTTLEILIRPKQLRVVKAGKWGRIPLRDVERVAQEGFRLPGRS